MKKSASKRILSLLISVAMLFTSFPVFSIVANAQSYVSNFANTPYVSEVTTNNMVAQFNFKGTLDGVDKQGNTLGVTVKNGTVSLSSLGSRDGVAQVSGQDTPGSYADVNTNPLAGKDLINSGSTITFWHNQFHYKESVNDGYGYNPVVTFYQDAYHYVAFTYGGYILYADGASGGQGIYRDYKTNGSTDIVGIPYDSTTVTAQTNDVWCHYGFSITNNSVSIYVDGVRYDYTTADGSTTPVSGTTNNYDIDYSSSSCIPTNILKFITNRNTIMSIGSYKPFPQPAYVSYIDDIRVYDKALSQIELRSIYGENDDSIYKYAEGHDPTIIENVNYGKAGYEGEYRYYMFGTAMTIYGSNDLANWTEIADSQGRTGYQNEEYWGTSANTGANYLTVLKGSTTTGTAAPLNWSGNTDSYSNDKTGTGAGKMVWAPSVYYNKNTGKYMLVSAASSWGSPISCIFTAESDSIEGPYYNITPLLYSGFNDASGADASKSGVKAKLDSVNGYSYSSDSSNPHRKYIYSSWGKYYFSNDSYPNCIDACPFYAADGNLYMSLGSWGGGIWMVKLSDDGLSTDSQWMFDNGYDPYYGVKIAAVTSASLAIGSGEGSFCYYDSKTGSTYLNISYGSVHQYQYTMRVWKTNNACPMQGGFTDVTGTLATTANSDVTVSGMKLMGNYTFTGSNLQYYDNGHCSYMTVGNNGSNDAGKTFISYHMRVDKATITERALTSTNYLNEARVHQVVYNEDGWQCVLPYQYSGETFNTSTNYDIAGTYSILDHGNVMAKDFKSASRYVFTYADEATKISGNISDVYGNNVGTWSVSNNYLTMSINGSTSKGVLLKMMDELGTERLVFSAVGTTSQNAIWGVQTGLFDSSAQWSNPDAKLTIDSEVYVHGKDDTYTTSSAFYYGTEIEDGTYNTDNVCNVYIAEGWTIDSIVNADGNASGEYYSVSEQNKTQKTINGVKCNGRYLQGTVKTDPQGGQGYDLALNVTYHKNDDPTDKYVERVYTWVRSSTVEAHSVAAGYVNYHASIFASWETRSCGIVMKLQGSEGSAVAKVDNVLNTNEQKGIGNYRSLADFTSKQGWITETSEVDNSAKNASYCIDLDSAIKAGSFNIGYRDNNGNAFDLNTGNVATVTGKYYLDISQHNVEGATVDGSGNWKITVPISGVPEYRGTFESQYISSATASDNINWSVTSLSDLSTAVANKTEGSLQEALYTSGQGVSPSKVYNSTISGKGTVTDSTISITEQHETGKPHVSAQLVLSPVVYVYDKSITRNAIEKATSADIKSNRFYTEETYNEYLEAIRVANAFVNNVKNVPAGSTDYTFANQDITVVSGGSTYVIATNGVTKDGKTIFDPGTPTSSSQATFSAWIDHQHDSLFSIDLYDDFDKTYTEAKGIITAGASEYTDESFAEFSNLMKNYDSYSSFINDVNVADGEVSWRDIADSGANADNYNPADTNMTAKENYETAVYNLNVALAHLRYKADYTGLESEISSNQNFVAQRNGLYEDVDSNGVYNVDSDIQHYTISSWVPYSNAYDTAVATENAKSSNDKRYANASVTITNAANGASTTVTSDDITYGADGTIISCIYSEIQNKIFNDTSALNEKVGKLKEPVDYDAYNSATELLKYQDIGAFTSEYINDPSSPFGVVTSQGTKESYVKYDIGADVNSPIECTTPAYSSSNADEKAYVVYNSSVYKDTSSQASLDDKTNKILSGLTDVNTGTDSSKRATYQVKFVEVYDGVINENSPVTYYYGQTVSFTPSQGKVYKWNISVNDTTTQDIPSSDSYTLTIQGNTTVTAYTTSETVSENNTLVKISNIYGIDVQQYSVNSSYKLVLSEGACSITDANSNVVAQFNAEVVPFYHSTGWYLNGRSINYGTYNLADIADENSSVILKPKYNVDPNAFDITFDSSVINTVFDGKVSLVSSDANAYAIAYFDGTDYYVVNYGNTYDFYATAASSFVTITKTDSKYCIDGTEITNVDLINSLDSKLPFASSIGKKDSSSFTIFSAPSLNAGVEITEMGTVYASSAVAWDESNLVIGGTSGGKSVYKIQAKNPDELAQQYFLKINSTAGIVARSYVKYSYTVNGTTIQTIAYGNIVSSN